MERGDGPRPDASSLRAVAPVAALDVIFSAMVGRRVYQPMGFRVTVAKTLDEHGAVGLTGETIATKRPGESVLWEWMQELHDWVDLATGDVLSGYEPTEAYTALVTSISTADRTTSAEPH
jgi:hypothetical protein